MAIPQERFYTEEDYEKLPENIHAELIDGKIYDQAAPSRRHQDILMELAGTIRDYIKALSEYGTMIGEPYIKHIDGEIWELRPLKNRFLYAYYKDNKFIVLHHFIKKTQKTPKHEIEQAKRNLKDYLERNE